MKNLLAIVMCLLALNPCYGQDTAGPAQPCNCSMEKFKSTQVTCIISVVQQYQNGTLYYAEYHDCDDCLVPEPAYVFGTHDYSQDCTVDPNECELLVNVERITNTTGKTRRLKHQKEANEVFPGLAQEFDPETMEKTGAKVLKTEYILYRLEIDGAMNEYKTRIMTVGVDPDKTGHPGGAMRFFWLATEIEDFPSRDQDGRRVRVQIVEIEEDEEVLGRPCISLCEGDHAIGLLHDHRRVLLLLRQSKK